MSEFRIGLEGGRKENDFVGKVRNKRGRRWGDEERFGSIEISVVRTKKDFFLKNTQCRENLLVPNDTFRYHEFLPLEGKGRKFSNISPSDLWGNEGGRGVVGAAIKGGVGIGGRFPPFLPHRYVHSQITTLNKKRKINSPSPLNVFPLTCS